MTIDTSKFQDFLDLSAALTGYTHVALQGTGQASLYYSTLVDIVGETTVAELLSAFRNIATQASGESVEHGDGLRRDLLSSDKLGPVARNVIKLWYVGTWYQLPDEWRNAFGARDNDITAVVSPVAFTEGLLWPTLGVNPPAAKAQGYGSWGHRPSVAP